MTSKVKYRSWTVPDPCGALVLVHGMGAGTERWEYLAQYFNRKNVSVYAVSLRGFDGTGGLEGHVDSFETYHSDIKDLCEIVRKEVPSGKLFLLGESMGAVIVFDMAARGVDICDGCILISPAFRSRLKFHPARYLQILAAMLFAPRKQFRMPFNARMCTADTEAAFKMEKDPAEHRYATAGLLFEIFKRQVSAAEQAKKITLPVLFLLSMDDDIVDPEKSIRVFGNVGKEKETGPKAPGKVTHPANVLKKYPGMKHALSVEAGRENVFDDIYNWAFG